MRFLAVSKILGIFLMIFSLSMLPPVFVSFYYHDHSYPAFIVGFLITFTVGFLAWAPVSRRQYELKTRDGFLVVTLFWVVLSLFAAIPLYISLYPHMIFTDSFFESVSGLTTTGATVLSHLSALPRAILYYRMQMHFLGGMGIIVLAVAILPMLGIGGMQLYRAETVGPIKTSKLRPRMAESAKALWYIYVGLVVVCAIAYWLAGMTPFDAIGESFSTLSTGGFSTHDSSFAFYHSTVIDSIGIIFMLLGACNFGLHYQFLKRRNISIYFFDPEFRAYLILLLSISIIVVLTLAFYHHFEHGQAVINALFTVVSMSTTTGLTTVNFSAWPTFLPYMIMFVALIGGCGASTAGGIKMLRCLLLKEHILRELKRLIHPKAVLAIRLGSEQLSESVVQAIWGFVSIFVILFVVLLLMLLATGLPLDTAFGALAGCLSNTGAGIAGVAGNFEHIPVSSKWILIFSMIAGRLEIFTILVLLTTSYWRK